MIALVNMLIACFYTLQVTSFHSTHLCAVEFSIGRVKQYPKYFLNFTENLEKNFFEFSLSWDSKVFKMLLPRYFFTKVYFH